MVFIFIAVLLLAFIIDLFSIISTKQELDHAADQMVKQIQLSGGVNSETDELFEFLSSQIEGAENISYSIDATYTSPRPSGMTNAIQLGTPFFITIEGDAKLGGFWNFDLVNITVIARGSGVSEHYCQDKDHPLLPIFIGYCTNLIPPPPLIEFSLVLGSLP